MKAVIQKVIKARVLVDNETISSIGKGLCILVGISKNDTAKDMEYIVRKILNLRIFENDDGKRWSLNVMDRNLEILCISQFTLHSICKGNKLDFHNSMPADQSQEFYNQFLAELSKKYKPDVIKDGKFGAYMSVDITNDGPVTICLDSQNRED